MGDRASGEIDIAASPADVMGVLADFESYTEWVGQLTSARVLERDGEGRGARAAFEVTSPFMSASYTLAYVYAPDDAGMSWTYVEGTLEDLQGSYRLDRSAVGTHVTYQLEVGLRGPIPGLIKRQAARQIVRTALNDLKRRVEASSG